MRGGEESLPFTALIGLMRSRVNRRTNERAPLRTGTNAPQRLSSHIAKAGDTSHKVRAGEVLLLASLLSLRALTLALVEAATRKFGY